MDLLKTRFFCVLTVIILAIGCLSTLSFADKIVLEGGQIITGEILADKADSMFIDIGFDVLKLPKSGILEYVYTDSFAIDGIPDSEPEKVVTPVVEEIDKSNLYRTFEREKTSVERCVNMVSEAVVKVATPAGMGSGFFINEDGYLVTNFHVIEKETRIEVTVFKKAPDGFEKESFKKVKIIAMNPFVDLALLKVEDIADTQINYVPLGDIKDIVVGEPVFAIGNPLGLERTVTDGVISTKARAFDGLVYLQTNADINPGNSGGPLFNLAGEVVGVTNMGYAVRGGLGFAIPVDYVKSFLDNREAFAFDKDNPNSGYRYLQPDKRRNKSKPVL